MFAVQCKIEYGKPTKASHYDWTHGRNVFHIKIK